MEELGMTAGEFAEAFKSPGSKNEKESREYIESFYNIAAQGTKFKDLENKLIKIKTFYDSRFIGRTLKGKCLQVIDDSIWIDVFSPSEYANSHQYIWLSDIEHIEEIKHRKRYVKAKGRILLTSKATHELTETIVDGGYCDHTLNKGSLVTIGKEWTNWYGRWVKIIDEQGNGYDIRPDKVPEVTKELTEQADTIQELCDNFIVTYDTGKPTIFDNIEEAKKQNYKALYGAIWTDKGLKYVGKENKNGELELL